MHQDNLVQHPLGGERRSRRAGDTPRAWSGREIVRVQPGRPCRRCQALRGVAWRVLGLLALAASAAVTSAVGAWAFHLITWGRG